MPPYVGRAEVQCQGPTMEPSQTVSLMLFVVGMLSTLTVLWFAARRTDQAEQQRARVNRMRQRLNRLIQERL